MTMEIKQLDMIEKQEIGLKRNISQIGNTITFELKRFLKNFLLILSIFLAVFIVSLIVQELQYMQDVPLPEDPLDYINSYISGGAGMFGMFGFLIILSTAGFAGSIIAEDFHKQTGNLIFPKIGKTRLLIGRIISRYGLNAICICFYFIMVGSVTLIKYGEIPIVLWGSMLWALLYTFMLFTFVTLMSSIMKSTAISIIISILFLLIVFNMISMILRFAGLEGEPFYILTYYEGIIANSMAMPDLRYTEIRMPTGMGGGGGGGGEFVTFIFWTTPSEFVALIGMLIFISVFLCLTYFLYKRRQSKSE